MNDKSFCSPWEPPQGSRNLRIANVLAVLACALLSCSRATWAGDAPQWVHAQVNAGLPDHDEKTNAVLLYAEDTLTVQGNGKIKRVERRVYKILRPDGRRYGTVLANFDSETKINSIRGWCVPAQGKDYEVKDKDAIETSLFGVQNGELMSDVKTKVLTIPASDPGNIVGYEVDQEVHPYVIQDIWNFQFENTPVREAHYTLQIPAGWEYKAAWLNHPEVPPTGSSNQWQWTVSDVKAIKSETDMPPWEAVAGQLVLSLIPPGGGGNKGFQSWADMARWEEGLVRGRRDVSPEIKQKVMDLTKSDTTQLGKMRSVSRFVQKDVRYVAIQLGIGGWQPHPAADVYAHKYGDCKDKATLLSAMLQELGVESYYVFINTTRGAVTPTTPAIRWFNHVILAIKIPQETNDPSLTAVLNQPDIGKILFFDPTDEWTPFGRLRGELQANYALLLAGNGGDLIQLPQLPASLNGVVRTAKLNLSLSGTLTGDFVEQRNGDSGDRQRAALKSVSKETDRVKYLESLISHSLSTFQLMNASVGNLNDSDHPFIYQYSLQSPNYAKTAGNLLLVRPRVVGTNSSDLLETKEPRRYPVEFDGPFKNSDMIEIAIPAGFEVDDLPPPVNVDYGFASYHSKTEASGNTLKYSRTFEVKELSVPVSKADDLKKLYRIVATDERNTAVLKPAGAH